jgi:hypothetical protein
VINQRTSRYPTLNGAPGLLKTRTAAGRPENAELQRSELAAVASTGTPTEIIVW